MIEFSVRDSLDSLKNKNYSNNINNTISILLEKFDEHQLRVLSMNMGIKIDNGFIRLHFYDNVGFRCYNENFLVVGKLPLCNNIEKHMNKLYRNYVNESINQSHI